MSKGRGRRQNGGQRVRQKGGNETQRDWSTWGGWGSWSSGRMSTAPPSSACALMRARAWSHGWMTKRRHIAIEQGAWPEEQAEAPPAQAASPVCCSVDGLNEVHALLPGNEVTVTLNAHEGAPSYRQRSTTDLRASSCPLSTAPCPLLTPARRTDATRQARH